MGGDAFITMMVDSYFDELVEDRMISKFFKNVPMVAETVVSVTLPRDIRYSTSPIHGRVYVCCRKVPACYLICMCTILRLAVSVVALETPGR